MKTLVIVALSLSGFERAVKPRGPGSSGYPFREGCPKPAGSASRRHGQGSIKDLELCNRYGLSLRPFSIALVLLLALGKQGNIEDEDENETEDGPAFRLK
jgi:hypothetical protein